MKYCSRCGTQVSDDAVFCGNCGNNLAQARSMENINQGGQMIYNQQAYQQATPAIPARKDDGIITAIKIFLIIGCISIGWTIIPLAWCIPITVMVWKRLNSGQPVGMGLKICTLLFVNLIAGILLLCANDL